MARLLYIEASPRKKRSASIQIAKDFLNEYSRFHNRDEVAVVDVWTKRMPALDGDVIEAKYAVMHNKPQTQEQARAWKQVEDIITEFKNADKYVISLPMWNFSIPYTLKHYIDLLVQPGYTFTYSPEAGYKGLVTGKKLLLICARGGSYSQGSGAVQLDLQTRYMETIFEFIGFQNIQKLIIEPTLSSDEKKQEILAQAKAEALKLASQF